MPKEEWGTKRVCPTTGKRFYDLNRDPIVSPYTGEVVELETTGKSRATSTAKAAPKAKETEEPAVIEETDDDSDVELADDVLEDDEDEDNVSLDDLADVASDDTDR